MSQAPTEPGLFWARRFTQNEPWEIMQLLHYGEITLHGYPVDREDIVEWGPRIVPPSVPDLSAVNPPHYDGDACMRTIAAIGFAYSFCIGTAIKHLWRAGRKGPVEVDVGKARWYLDWLTNNSLRPDADVSRQIAALRKPLFAEVEHLQRLCSRKLEEPALDLRPELEAIAKTTNAALLRRVQGTE